MKSNPFAHRPPREWLKITVCVPQHHADLTAGFLMDLTGSGIEQQTVPITPMPDSETIIAYLEKNARCQSKKTEFEAFLAKLADENTDFAPPSCSYTEIIEEDWNNNWKAFYKPLRLTDSITVKPTWEPYNAESHEIVIEIDPGMAFGTGLHDSTQLALQLIERSFVGRATPQKILDVGTGTGILGMACALLGAKNVLAIDNDPDAIAAARENVEHNNLSHVMTVEPTDLNKIEGPFDLIVANITQDVLTSMACQLISLLAKQGHLVLAGILKGEQADTITRLFYGKGLTLLESPWQKEWQAFLFKK
ncbi:MAG: 50S ribosomal protein L11 methyltransferase [Deltaproteobacteria bacterium]|nr:50S ribosomal protein L11 methyltransferase [Deltaproteobacteria bacterium]